MNTYLEIDELCKWYPIQRGLLRKTVGHIKAVDKVSFELAEGETLGLVGESGCGKSTLVRTILHLEAPTSGSVRIRQGGDLISVGSMNARQRKEFRRSAQIVFQNPATSMNPTWTVEQIICEPLLVNQMGTPQTRRDRALRLLKMVGLDASQLDRRVDSFSGGQKQRIGIARALALEPRLVIADEPVSALDVSVQSQILNLLNELSQSLGLTYLFIAHDLHVVKYLCDRIAVMYLGQLVEVGSSDDVYRFPRHPYTEALLGSIPVRHPKQRNRPRTVAAGDLPDPAAPPTGCHFHPRCPYAEDRCQRDSPPLVALGDGRWVACHLVDKLELSGGA